MHTSTAAFIGAALGLAFCTANADLVKSSKRAGSAHKRAPRGDYTLSDNLVFSDERGALGVEPLNDDNGLQTYVTFRPDGDLSKIRFQRWGEWDRRVFVNANADEQQVKLGDEAGATKWNASEVAEGVWHIMDSTSGLAWAHGETSGPIGLSRANPQAEGQKFKMHETITLRTAGGSDDEEEPRKTPVKKESPRPATSPQPAKPSQSGRADDGPFMPENLGTNGVYRMEKGGRCPHVVPVGRTAIRAVRKFYGPQDQWDIKRETWRGDTTATFESVSERQMGRPAFLSVKNERAGQVTLGTKATQFKIEDGHTSGTYIIREPKTNRVLAMQEDCGALVLAPDGKKQPWGFKKVA